MIKTKNFFFFLILIFFSHVGLSQEDTSFYKTYSSGPFDVGQGIVQLSNKSYAITGSSSSFSDNSSQAFIMIIDSVGNQQWTKPFGGSESDWGRRIFHKENEGFWVAGYSNSYSTSGDYDFMLYKTDEDGNLEWAKNYGSENWERLWDAKQLADDSFILVGEAEGGSAQKKDIYIVKADLAGDTIWTKTIQTPENEIAYSIEILNDTSVVIVGEQWENGSESGYILEVKMNGEIIRQWTTKEYGPTSFRDVSVLDEEIYVIGYFKSLQTGFINTIFLRLDENYQTVASEIGNTDGDDYGTNMLILGYSRVYWTLKTQSPAFNVFEGGWDLFLLRYDVDMFHNGLSLGFSGVNDDEVFQMIPAHDGGFIMVGKCSDIRESLSAGSNIMVIKIGPNDEFTSEADQNNDFVSVEKYNQNNILIYPNPFSDKITLKNIPQNSTITLYDQIGKTIPFSYSENNSILNLNHLARGTYTLAISRNKQHYMFKIVKL